MNLQTNLFDQPVINATFYNTVELSGIELKQAKEDTKAQDEAIHQLYIKHRNLSPWSVHRILKGKWPITSVRRAINSICNEGKILKTAVKVKGEYGKPEHMWTLNLNYKK